MRRVAALIRADLQIDQKQMFIAGFGQGAVEAQVIAGRTPDLWAGVIVLGAGDAGEPGNAKALAGMAECMIAAGQNQRAREALMDLPETLAKEPGIDQRLVVLRRDTVLLRDVVNGNRGAPALESLSCRQIRGIPMDRWNFGHAAAQPTTSSRATRSGVERRDWLTMRLCVL